MRLPSRRGRSAAPVPPMGLGTNIAVMLVLAVISAGAIGALLWWLLGRPLIRVHGPWTASESFDFVKIVLTVVGGIGGVAALVIAYRKQRLGEAAEHREDTKLFTDRFTKAAEQLGSDKAAVRLAGVYALGELADDWRAGQQSCIDVLCAYLRMPYTLPGSADEYRAAKAEQQVRHTVIRLITAHLRREAPASWRGRDFDFTGAVFDGGEFRNALFAGGAVSFDEAEFTDGTVSFENAEFTEATVSFEGTKFAGGTVSFEGAEFAGGTVSFKGAKFTAGSVYFSSAKFTGGFVSFNDAEFAGGTGTFHHAKFTAGSVSFHRARFTAGTVYFYFAEFVGGAVSFEVAGFAGGTVSFDDAEFAEGTVSFEGAEFTGGSVSFEDTGFVGGAVSFDEAEFAAGAVSFHRAKFAGGTVDLSHAADWSCPPQFDQWDPLPPGLKLSGIPRNMMDPSGMPPCGMPLG